MWQTTFQQQALTEMAMFWRMSVGLLLRLPLCLLLLLLLTGTTLQQGTQLGPSQEMVQYASSSSSISTARSKPALAQAAAQPQQ
jgi:hypothetical protein